MIQKLPGMRYKYPILVNNLHDGSNGTGTMVINNDNMIVIKF